MINRNLYLEETGGWMECERCSSITKGIICTMKMHLPALQLKDDPRLLSSSGLLSRPA